MNINNDKNWEIKKSENITNKATSSKDWIGEFKILAIFKEIHASWN